MATSSKSTEPQQFWSEYQPGFRFTAHPVGTPEFFRAVEEHRYGLEPAIPEMARFPEWGGRDVLEAGCGIATDGINFARNGARYTGIDFSPTAIELARRRFRQESREGNFEQASITGLPVGDGSQDLVYSNGVIHHLAETERAVAEMHRVLRPGGRALVMVYHRDSLNYRVNIMLIRRALVAGLLVPGVTQLAGASGEDPEVLAGHRQLLFRHGRRYVLDHQLFLDNNTDGPGNPLSKVYGRAEIAAMFGAFSRVETRVRFLNLRLYPWGERIARTALARRLERRYGWHLWVEATK
jgi:ubiquinone/menaquinone biosynthesis C-methylase UbiE